MVTFEYPRDRTLFRIIERFVVLKPRASWPYFTATFTGWFDDWIVTECNGPGEAEGEINGWTDVRQRQPSCEKHGDAWINNWERENVPLHKGGSDVARRHCFGARLPSVRTTSSGHKENVWFWLPFQ